MNHDSLRFKLSCIRTLLEKASADAILFVSSFNIIWSVGLNIDDSIVVATKNKIFLLVDKRSFSYCKKILNPKITLLPYDSIKSLKQVLTKNSIKTLIIENDYLTFQQYENIVKPLQVKIIRVDTKPLRIVKTLEELRYLEKAADIAVNAINKTRKWLKVGVSELEVKNYLHNLMIQDGASAMSFDLIVAFGINTANPHHKSENTVLKNNSLVTIDIGCIYNNYCSDITRSFFFGNKPNKAQRHMYDLVFKAQQLGLKTAKVGLTGAYIDKKVRDFILKDKVYGKLFVHGLGHGVGIEIHELPTLNPKYDKEILHNSVVTIEPGVYKDNFGGVRIEDTIVVTNKGIINLTEKATKDFFVK